MSEFVGVVLFDSSLRAWPVDIKPINIKMLPKIAHGCRKGSIIMSKALPDRLL